MSLEGSCILSQQIIVDYGKKKERKKMYLRRPPGFHKNSTFNQKTLASNAWLLYLNKNKKAHDDISWPPRNVSEFSSSLLAETVSSPCQLHTV